MDIKSRIHDIVSMAGKEPDEDTIAKIGEVVLFMANQPEGERPLQNLCQETIALLGNLAIEDRKDREEFILRGYGKVLLWGRGHLQFRNEIAVMGQLMTHANDTTADFE